LAAPPFCYTGKTNATAPLFSAENIFPKQQILSILTDSAASKNCYNFILCFA